MVVIDGTHRLYAAIESGGRELLSLVVECDATLPSVPLPNWNSTQLLTEKVATVERYDRFNCDEFRPCGEAILRWALSDGIPAL